MKIEMKEICKSFGANEVLQSVNFTINTGEISALLGENGAGKSTLMNILGGVLQPDRGEIIIDGRTVSFAAPIDSLHSGIGFIHQELNLINDLTVYENLFITDFLRKGVFLDTDTMRRKSEELFKEMDIDLDPCEMVRNLDASYKQIVEICKALMQQASIIIMDEPTTSLTVPEIERVFKMMRVLRNKNVGIVFISHKLEEVLEICDSYVVLRDGKVAAKGNVKETSIPELTSFMVGHEVKQDKAGGSCHNTGDAPALEISNLSDGMHFHDISLKVSPGEVLGVTGLLGDGRTELFQTIFGAMGGNYTGTVRLCGETCHFTSTEKALEHGLAYLPRNRKENAIIKDMNILDNGSIVYLPHIRNKGMIDIPRQEQMFNKQVKELSIKLEDIYDPISSLSGGNQQKVVLAKWLMSEPKVLILDNPTQGVDVGAKEEIYEIIEGLAGKGTAVIVLSSEAKEIIRLCSRSVVLFHGREAGELTGNTLTEHNIMILATGGSLQKCEESHGK